ncbi:sensor histidine kinase [Sediminitomix flava]|uniref:Histidine kinase n=1 Tax=Sediminitomix flava TaxID=379075 RepID=A0A315ZHD9_SEDFL|nr:histidine kinase [Sediminitomix flava]PWJ44208.1 histidine kinase [Sediminitomix flava]
MSELKVKQFFGWNLLLIMAFFSVIFQFVLLAFDWHYNGRALEFSFGLLFEFIINYFNLLFVAGMTFKIVNWLNTTKLAWSSKTAFIRTFVDFIVFSILTFSWILFVNQIISLIVGKDLITGEKIVYLLAVGTIVNLFLVPIIELMVLMNTHYESELRTKQLLHENTKYRYELLKNQINPHFLFNSLSVLSPLISISQDKAKKYVNSFSIVLRHVLDFKDSDLIELKEEFKFLEHYTFLLKTRFGEAFVLKIENKTACDRKYILPMVLQLLIENVVKHNKMSDENPMVVTLKVKEDGVEVSNPIAMKSSTSSWGIGLENIKMRYNTFGQEIVIENKDNVFKVFVPFIEAL